MKRLKMDKSTTIEDSKYTVAIFGGLGVGRTSILEILMKSCDFNFQETTVVFDYHPFLYNDFLASYGTIDYDNIDLLLFIIDIQNRINSVRSGEYLEAMLTFFRKKKIKIAVAVLFHKYDPELRAYYDHDLQDRAANIKDKITNKHRKFQIHYQETSIHDSKSIDELNNLMGRLSRIRF